VTYGMSLASCPRARKTYRVEILHLHGNPVTAAMRRDATKGTPAVCVSLPAVFGEMRTNTMELSCDTEKSRLRRNKFATCFVITEHHKQKSYCGVLGCDGM
jgi:hypothetical protein